LAFGPGLGSVRGRQALTATAIKKISRATLKQYSLAALWLLIAEHGLRQSIPSDPSTTQGLSACKQSVSEGLQMNAFVVVRRVVALRASSAQLAGIDVVQRQNSSKYCAQIAQIQSASLPCAGIDSRSPNSSSEQRACASTPVWRRWGTGTDGSPAYRQAGKIQRQRITDLSGGPSPCLRCHFIYRHYRRTADANRYGRNAICTLF
jgi:hypothetical protein